MFLLFIPLISEAATGGVLQKKVFLKTSQISFRPSLLLKRDSSTDVSSEMCEICQNTYLEKHLRTDFFCQTSSEFLNHYDILNI